MAQYPGLFTTILIALNLAISFWAFSSLRRGGNPARFLFSPYAVAHGKGYEGALLSQFSHADLGHLIFNMLTLYYFGRVVEAHVAYQLLTIYFVAGFAALIMVFLFHRGNPDYRVLGASGSVTGVLFASIVMDPSMSIYFLFLPIPVPSPLFAVLYLVMSTVLMARGDLTRVSHEAHLGGAILGLILGAAFSPYGYGPLIERFQHILGH